MARWLLRSAHRVLLRLYPRDFRATYGADLAAGYERAEEEGRAVREVVDLARNLPGTWLEGAGARPGAVSMGGGGGMDGMGKDLRYAARALARQPAFTAVVVLTLGIGIGANAGVLGVLDAVLLSPFSWPDDEELVHISESYQASQSKSVAYLNFVDWRDRNRVFEHVGAHGSWSFTLTGTGPATEISSHVVSHELFDVLDLAPAMGRRFTSDDEAAQARVTILTHGTWASRFGEDPDIVGTTIVLDGVPWEVIGVLPPDVDAPIEGAEVLTPVASTLSASDLENRGSHPGLAVYARLADGVTLDQAVRDMERVTADLEAAYPGTNREAGATLQSFRARFLGDSRTLITILGAASAIFLFLVGANVANLLVARATGRRREVAVRAALGAERGRLVRLLLIEVGILAALAGVAGFGVAALGLDILASLQPADLPRIEDARIDARLFLVSLGLGLLAALAAGVLPALRLATTSPQRSFRSGGGAGARRGRSRVRRGLVVAQVATATALLVGAGLMMRSVDHLTDVDPGLDTEDVLVARVPVSFADYPAPQDRVLFYRRALERARSIPGVTSVGAVDPVPLDYGNRQFTLSGAGHPRIPDEEGLRVDTYRATPDYFATMGIPVLAGVVFDGTESEADQRIVIDETLVDRLWPGDAPSDVLGRTLRFRGDDSPTLTIQGVVGHVRHYGFRDEGREQIYLPYSAAVWSLSFVLRGESDPLALLAPFRAAIAELDPAVPVTDVKRMADLVTRQTAEERMLGAGLGALGLVAVVLSVLGLYGVLSYGVLERTREIGVRMALGAPAGRVVRSVVAEGVLLAGIGVVLGLCVALGAGRLLGSLLYGVGGVDPVTFLGVAVGFTAVAAVASLLPARRVARIQPAETLRAEA